MNSIQHPSNFISLSKGTHRQQTVIWLHFTNRKEWVKKIKLLKESKFSRTHNKWYIPYSSKSFHHFKRLQIPYQIPGTHQDSEAIKENVSSKDDHTSISSANESSSVHPKSTKLGTDIQVSSPIEVTWNYQKFALALPYSSYNITEVKKLEGAWWHAKEKKWICKGTIRNLEKIQAIWKPFDQKEYKKWFDKISIVNNPCKLILYYSPKHQGRACLQVIGYGANHEYVKRISNRMYYKEGKFYTIPYQKSTVQRILEEYTNLGYKIINRLPEYVQINKK